MNTVIEGLTIHDGFHVPIKMHSKSRMASTYLTLTDHGFYKYNWMVLTNHELYLFHDRHQDDYNKLLILTPGVFVKTLPKIKLKNIKDKNNFQSVNEIFPIELYVGGSKFGQQGVFTFGF